MPAHTPTWINACHTTSRLHSSHASSLNQTPQPNYLQSCLGLLAVGAAQGCDDCHLWLALPLLLLLGVCCRHAAALHATKGGGRCMTFLTLLRWHAGVASIPGLKHTCSVLLAVVAAAAAESAAACRCCLRRWAAGSAAPLRRCVHSFQAGCCLDVKALAGPAPLPPRNWLQATLGRSIGGHCQPDHRCP